MARADWAGCRIFYCSPIFLFKKYDYRMRGECSTLHKQILKLSGPREYIVREQRQLVIAKLTAKYKAVVISHIK